VKHRRAYVDTAVLECASMPPVDRRKRRGLRRASDRITLTTLHKDIKSCHDHIARLERKLDRLTDTVHDLRDKVRS
jgi:hypothetical protein